MTLQVYQCMRFYFDGPTYFSSHVVPQTEAAFPAMTVCPEEKRYKQEVLEVRERERERNSVARSHPEECVKYSCKMCKFYGIQIAVNKCNCDFSSPPPSLPRPTASGT